MKRFEITLELVAFFFLFGFTLCHLVFGWQFLCREDGFVENLSVIFWAAGTVFAFLITCQMPLEKKVIAWICLVVCIVAAGEEMSWGQRIFNFQTPDFIARANRQSEFNLHNLFVLSGGSSWRYFFKTGQFDWRQIFDVQNLFRIGFLTFFFLFPLLCQTKSGRKILSRWGYYEPNPSFSFLAAMFILFSFLILIGQKASFSRSIQEIREMSYALIMALYLGKFYLHVKTKRAATLPC